MNPTLRLGRIFGIEIGFNWSLIFIFVLIAWSLADTLPSVVPGHPAAEYWVAGVVGAVVFYVSLLAHELAHAVVASRLGVKVEGITLWLFGGVSRLSGQPARASYEAAITAVGPLTSLVVGGVCFLVSIIFNAVAPQSVPAVVAEWLASINVLLALFNLVPAFPLDGGRLLSSLLWWRGGNRARALHQAVRVGRLFAFAMIALGFVELITGSTLNGIWIAFLGWFLISAGSAEESGAILQEALRSVPVSAAMTSPVITVPDWITLEGFFNSVVPNHRFTTYPLHGPDGRITGVLRLSDAMRHRGPEEAERQLVALVRDLPQSPRARPDEELMAVLERTGMSLDRRLLVFDGDTLVGIVSPADVARLLTLRQVTSGAQKTT